MKYCCFFGHRDCGDEVYQRIENVIISLLEREDAEVFLVGEQGRFDLLVRKALKELSGKYPSLKYYVVQAYLNREVYDPLGDLEAHAMFPEGLENVPPRFAIDRRNRWMVSNSDCVIGYVTSRFGNAYKYLVMAEKKGKAVINLGKLEDTEKL